MIIYLDESKRLGKGQIVIGGFLSFHNTHYIDTFVRNKKKELNIKENIELKSINKFGKLFMNKMSSDEDFNDLNIISFGFHFNNYFFDSSETYMNLLLEIISNIIDNNKMKFDKKNIIIQDNINCSDDKIFENKIRKILKLNFGLDIEFKLRNSKNILSLQLADLIVGEYKKLYFFDDINYLEDYLLEKDFENQKI